VSANFKVLTHNPKKQRSANASEKIKEPDEKSGTFIFPQPLTNRTATRQTGCNKT
jgi:hypothetical protein